MTFPKTVNQSWNLIMYISRCSVKFTRQSFLIGYTLVENSSVFHDFAVNFPPQREYWINLILLCFFLMMWRCVWEPSDSQCVEKESHICERRQHESSQSLGRRSVNYQSANSQFILNILWKLVNYIKLLSPMNAIIEVWMTLIDVFDLSDTFDRYLSARCFLWNCGWIRNYDLGRVHVCLCHVWGWLSLPQECSTWS